ncbi:MAG: hypothetical protein ABIR93_03415 [Saprospiraceae bacterium]
MQDKIETPADNHSLEYFPLNLGKFITYSVDSIVFDDVAGGNKKDTVSFQIKEEVVSYQIDLAGDTIFYLHRFRRSTSEDPWLITDLWTANRSTVEASRTEENLKFRKMTFPLRSGKRWSATTYIPFSTTVVIGTEMMQPYQEWESKVLDFDVSGQVGIFSFEAGQLMHISQSDTDDGSMKRFEQEVYARNIGLVSRTDSLLDSRCLTLGYFEPCFDETWLEKAGKGYILSQVMIDHN